MRSSPSLYLFLFLTLATVAFGQDRSRIDSLKMLIHAATSDSSEVHYINDLIVEFYNYNNDSILHYTQQLASVAENVNSDDYRAIANHHLGIFLLNESNYEKASELFLTNLNYYQSNDQIEKTVSSHYNLAVAYSELGDLEQSAQHYFQVLRYYKDQRDFTGMARAYNGLAITYETFREFHQAIDYYHKGLEILSSPEYNNTIDKANILSNLAELYLTMGKVDSAQYYIEKTIQINKILDLKWGLGYSYSILSAIALAEQRPQLALEHAHTSMSYRNIAGSPTEIGESHLALGKAYEAMDQVDSAEKHLVKALDLAQDKKQLFGIEQAAGRLASMYEQNLNYDKSLQYLKLQSDAKDSLLQQDQLKSLRGLQFKYEAAQKAIELNQKQLKIQKQNQVKVYLISGLIILSLFTLSIYLRYAKNKVLTQKELQLQRERISSLQKEQKLTAVNHVVEEQVNDRRQMATHLLDSLGAVLASSRLKLQRLKTQREEGDAGQLVLQTDNLIRDASSEIRRIAQEMMPEALIHLGLAAAISDLCHEIQERYPITIREEENLLHDKISGQQEVMIYNIIKEILDHIVTTSDASLITLKMQPEEESHLFTIEENASLHNLNDPGVEPLLRAKSQIKYLGGEMVTLKKETGNYEYNIILPF